MSMLASEGSSVIGLSSGQKATAGLGAIPTPKTQHPYVVGIALVLIGGLGLIGSVTGTLPSMIAALFVPDALIEPSTGNSPALGIKALGTLQNIANPLGNLLHTNLPGL